MYSQNLADLRKAIDQLSFPDPIELSTEQMHQIRKELTVSDPSDFPDGYTLVQVQGWHRFHKYDTQRFILRHKETDAYIRITRHVHNSGTHENDIRQVNKSYAIQSVYE